MYCNKCGSHMNDDEKFCTNCGAQNPNAQSAPAPAPAAPANNNAATQNYQAADNNTIAIVGFIFSFFGGLIGLICSIIGYNNGRKGAPHKNLALAGIIISVVVMVGSAILLQYIRGLMEDLEMISYLVGAI